MGKIFSAVLTKSPNMPEPEDYEAHFLHCVDYMRQAAMCAGDVAIEPRGENGQPGQVNLVNAFNGLHGKFWILESPYRLYESKEIRLTDHHITVCKDYSQVKSYLTRKYFFLCGHVNLKFTRAR